MEFKNYKKLTFMMGISFLIMYLVMYLNLASLDHFYFNINRLYMAALMVTPMALVMLMFMTGMYKNKKFNTVIVFSAVGLFLIVLFMERSQALVQDREFMRSMIPHHSSAILVSENADLTDPEVRKLAAQIIPVSKGGDRPNEGHPGANGEGEIGKRTSSEQKNAFSGGGMDLKSRSRRAVELRPWFHVGLGQAACQCKLEDDKK